MADVINVVHEVLGFADAISYVIRYVKAYLDLILPDNIALMFAIAFTVIVALSIKRSVVT